MRISPSEKFTHFKNLLKRLLTSRGHPIAAAVVDYQRVALRLRKVPKARHVAHHQNKLVMHVRHMMWNLVD